MGRYVITRGNSGIGLEIARQLSEHRPPVLLIGRDAKKCESARALIGSSECLPGDLSTHDGVRAIAKKLEGSVVDGLVHAAGMLTMKELRTADGLHPVFTVNYLSRYHLTQLLMPQ